MNSIRVLVVDDSLLMRTVITDIINSDPNLNVVGVAKDGADALGKIEKLKPDVVTLDIEMPVLDGLQALDLIMAQFPTSVIMLSSLTKSGANATIRALELGAVDFVQKPSSGNFLDLKKISLELTEKIKVASKARIPSLRRVGQTQTSINRLLEINKKFSSVPRWIVGIGTSTGGPRALSEVITKIPGSVPAAFLVVQHMPPGFTKSLAERLDKLSELNVKEAEDKEQLKSGYVYIAPGDFHLEIEQRLAKELPKIKLSQKELVSGHRPSVDVLFKSIADISNYNLLAAILTGMGSDGNLGIKKMKQRGAITLAESEKTCVVFGMPRVAIEQGSIDFVLPIEQIAQMITQKISR